MLTSRSRKGAPSTSYLLRVCAVVGADWRAVKSCKPTGGDHFRRCGRLRRGVADRVLRYVQRTVGSSHVRLRLRQAIDLARTTGVIYRCLLGLPTRTGGNSSIAFLVISSQVLATERA